jgi:putative DNA primase/helicase
MKQHFITIAILLVALVFYVLGYSSLGGIAFVIGGAFDSGNLPHVARALHEKFPDKPVIIAGDDDRHLESTQGTNPGRMKAEEAADLFNGEHAHGIQKRIEEEQTRQKEIGA